ncbi:hypothetical protein CPB83DRAFT_842935 [Crepidotus variabilis]|uniref:Peroxisome membrane anchor protein Pex14p N-terminal domain-containing protein n=1 Tax=Crepidotus variabilis TaxID=179855 RepID=A0A9P6JW75_9AGAR|nr:hypothetical protein CPB83DRAFT_842935 [Crepidotus variabilis]
MSDPKPQTPAPETPATPPQAPQAQEELLTEPQPTPTFVPTTIPGPEFSSSSRDELLAKARTFLASPQVQHQNAEARRAFLRDKGLSEFDINELQRTNPTQLPSIPPRTYPRPPPSNLPALFLALARLFSWLAGGSAVLLFVYHRFLLPKIAQTSLARQSFKSHHVSLLRHLMTSLAALKEQQAECFSVLPRPDPWKESRLFLNCASVEDILTLVGEKDPDFSQIPTLTLLRCGLRDFGKGRNGDGAQPTTEDLFRYLEGQIPWLAGGDGLQYEEQLWETLSTCPLFNKIMPNASSGAKDVKSRWEYIAPALKPDVPLVTSLDSLSAALPKGLKYRTGPFQHTLQSLSDFTGYLSTQVYLPYRPLNTQNNTTTVEDEIKREIKALKGLVLNRRTFMPTILRTMTTTPNHVTS